jgi:hypothetical protein
MDHHDDVAPARERLAVAGFLVRAVAAILGVDEDGESHFARERDGSIRAAVVDQDDLVDATRWHVGECCR